MISSSVRIRARRQNLKKRNVAQRLVRAKHHRNQLPAIPLRRTSSVTMNGVSAAKPVAAIEVPATHQGRERPLRKKSSMLRPARLEK